jgi:hypothetical protein
MRLFAAVVLSIGFLAGCAKRVSPADLDRINRPAFLARIETDAGPKAKVFLEDDSYRKKLGKLDAKEADRRLKLKLVRGATRFEVSERLRASTLGNLPGEPPWDRIIDPVAVASALQSFLVEEVPANEPDYDLLKPLQADAVIELVVSEFGMHSEEGKAGAYVKGWARLFYIDGGEAWRRTFAKDDVALKKPHLDPFRVAKEPEQYRARMAELLDLVGTELAHELNPPGRHPGPRAPTIQEQIENKPPPPARPEEEEGELPDPDPV